MYHDENENDWDGRWRTHPLVRAVALSLLISISTYLLARGELISDQVEVGLYIIAILIGGFHWSKEAFEKLFKRREVSIDFLMMAATVGSAILGMWDEAAFLVVLYGLAEATEEYTFARTRASIRKLLDLAPKEARLLRDGKEVMAPAESVQVGDIFRVKPGESLATDGVVADGRSSVDESPVTGESMPMEKTTGMRVFAASINHDGILDVRATASFADNSLSKLVHMVEEAREQKGRTQLFIDSFGRIYSPLVLLAATLMLVIPHLVGGDAGEWATRAVVLLVAAAPCALVMSTPVAISAGIGIAGRQGVLIKGGMHLESLGKIRAVAFDKTGTITLGKPKVTDVIPLDGDPENVLQTVVSLEGCSTHPLAHAILESGRKSGIEPQPVTGFRNFGGAGIAGTIGGKSYFVAKPAFFASKGIDISDLSDVERLRSEGKTVVLLASEDRVLAILAIADQVRPSAARAVSALTRMGLQTIILTGDNPQTGRAIANAVGISAVKAELKPEDKIAAIQELAKQHGPVAMVGDGINDAPALATAEVGIAMGAAGTDAAIEASDAALMGDDLEKLVYALQLGRRAKRISRQNIVFSIVLLAVLVPLAVLGMMNVAFAVAVHEVAELLAVANGLRVALHSKAEIG